MMSKRKTRHQETLTLKKSSKTDGAKSYAIQCLEKMNQFRQAGTLCDVVLESRDGTKFRAHKLVLASSSSYFQAMFTGEMLESTKDNIKLDIDSDSLEVLIDFVYTNKIELKSLESAKAVLSYANMLLMHELESVCCHFIGENITLNNCFCIAEFAEIISNQELKKSVIGFIQDDFADVAKKEGFLSLPLSFIECALASDKLNVKCESQALKAAIKWINYQPSVRVKDFASILEHVRLPFVPHQVLQDVGETEQELFTDAECSKYLEEAKTFHFQPEQRSLLQSARTQPRKSYPRKLYVVGGLAGFEGAEAYLKRIDCTELVPNMEAGEQWNQIKSMEVARESAAVVSLHGLIYVMGGVSYNADVSLVERYNPIADTWTTVASLNLCKGQVAGCVIDGWLYAVGGSDDGRRQGIKSVEKYRPLEDKWKSVPPMHTGRGALGIAVLEDRIYACGGAGFNFAFRSVEMYDSTKNKWFVRAQMNKPRAFHDVVALRGCLYALGGAEMRSGELTSIQDTVELYCPNADEWTLVESIRIPCWGLRAAVNTQDEDNLPDEVYIVGKFHLDSGYRTVAKLSLLEDSFFLSSVNFGLGDRIQAGIVLL